MKENNTIHVDIHMEKAPGASSKDTVTEAKQDIPNTAQMRLNVFGEKSHYVMPFWVIKMINNNNNEYSTALIWSCIGQGKWAIWRSLWILSRDLTISDDEYDVLIDYAKSTGINVNSLHMQKTNQTGCN